MTELRIATRRSPLAIWQAEHVADRLRAEHAGLDVSLVPMRTEGDRLLDAPLAKVGGKGLFVKELERALLDGRAEIAVHSVKDVPVDFPEGLHLAVILERADPRDAIVSRDGRTLAELPDGAVVGSSSLRRKSQLAHLRPDLRLVNLRGNVQTRLAKLEAGDVDATVLALSGLQRLEMEHVVAEVLEPEAMLPAIGQGALGVECKADDVRVNELLAPLGHGASSLAVRAERAVTATLGGGCQSPLAAFARLVCAPDGDRLELEARIGSLDGREVLHASSSGPAGDALAIGRGAANSLIGQGGGRLLEEVLAALDEADGD